MTAAGWIENRPPTDLSACRSAFPMNDKFPLKSAADAWCRGRIDVYNRCLEQIRIDADGAAAVTKDHVDRWLFELIQNAEDAEATAVRVIVDETAIYLADNGRGLSSSAVRSISALNLSDKSPQAIGRKGLGFKAVYCVTAVPAVFSGDEGIWFSEARARQFLEENGFVRPAKVPFTWLPIWQSRSDAAAGDATLAKLSDFQTVVRLPLREPSMANRCVEQAKALCAETLLTFRFLKRVEFKFGTENWQISVEPADPGVWKLVQGANEQRWRVAATERAAPPEALAEFVDATDRARCERVTCLVATLLDGQSVPTRFRPPPRLHVFYPTDVSAPLDILLHAEFVAKSDRTGIVPFSGSAFNSWLADVLAQEVVEFAQKAATAQRPEAGLLLLAPTGPTAEANTITGQLWEKIRTRAGTGLRVADKDGVCVLPANETVALASDLPGRAIVRRLLDRRSLGARLVHDIIEASAAATAVLAKVGGTVWSADALGNYLGGELAADDVADDWVWDVLLWVAEYRKARGWWWRHDPVAESVKNWRLIRLETGRVTPRELNGRNITWRDETLCKNLPDWLPVRCLAEHARLRLTLVGNDEPVRKLLDEFGLKAPSQEGLLEALEFAVRSFWKKPEGDPARFLEFLMHGNIDAEAIAKREGLKQCPVPAIGRDGPIWEQAGKCFFGAEWGNARLAAIYRTNKEVVWAVRPEKESERWGELLRALGVSDRPRLVTSADPGEAHEEYRRVTQRANISSA